MGHSRYEVDHNGITVTARDLTDLPNVGLIAASTKNLSVAELCEFPGIIKGLEGELVYYFNRIKVLRPFEGTGEGRALMIEICKIADKNKITIYNELNPYGKRGMKKVKEFFRASGFEDFKTIEGVRNAMIRRPQEKGV